MKHFTFKLFLLFLLLSIRTAFATEISGTANGHDYVDLGLPSGTLWATCNVGADSPEEYGDYFAWGETQPKDTYNWSTYKWMTEGMSAWAGITKYTYPDNQKEYNNDVVWYDDNKVFIGDNKKELDLEDDAANYYWGGNWSTPTLNNLEELMNPENCEWVLETINNIQVSKVISKYNGNYIILPFAGYIEENENRSIGIGGKIWGKELSVYSGAAYCIDYHDAINLSNYYPRSLGMSIRPVLQSETELPDLSTYTISFDANGGSGSMSAVELEEQVSTTIPTNTFTRHGYRFIGWNTKADGSGTSYADDETISITANTTLYAQWEEYKISGTANGHDYVDLGLPSGTLWATCNVGADSPEEYGDYFAWGETEPKEEYLLSNYKWCEGSSYTHTKYCTNSDYGTIDNKTILELSDDAANASWGGDWRMPGKEDEEELRTECTWTWITQNGVNGYKVTSKTNGNSIFLPAAGYRNNSDLNGAGSGGYYWSSSLSTNFSYNAYILYFYSSDVYSNTGNRSSGHSVRPVMRVKYTLMFDANGGSGNISAIELEENKSTTIPANTFTRHGYRFIGWNTKADGSGTSYADGETISITANTTLYAQWEERIYESSYVAKSFSISEDKTICFSSGNLQYHAANKEWRFAPSQLDYVGYENANISSSYNGWIDLFVWGSGDNPTSTSTTTSSKFIDWGVNRIGNYEPNTWRTLTDDEWKYIINGRPNAEELIGIAQVDGVNGLILLPDNWTCPSGVTFKYGFYDEDCIECYGNHQTFSASDWKKLETSGAIFLPATGKRSTLSSNINRVQLNGSYWSATWNIAMPENISFNSNKMTTSSLIVFDIRNSVRLVRTIYTLSYDANGGSGSMPAVELEENESTTIPTNTFTRHGYRFIGWNTKADGTGTSYTEGQTISLTENTTLYAQWEERIYESSYVAKSFSISGDETICFSPGNLQYNAANKEWRFAPSQLDYVGYENKNFSSSYNGWIDLFIYGEGDTPTTNMPFLPTSSFIDYGVNNIGNDAPNTWRTLTSNEWEYIIEYRPNAKQLIGVAEVDGVNGLILLPDNWVCPSEVTFKSGFADEDCIKCFGNYQTFSASDWKKLETSGAIFLPAAGKRTLINSNYRVQYEGRYMNSTSIKSFGFASNNIITPANNTNSFLNSEISSSIRLVRTIYTLSFHATDGSGSMPDVELKENESTTIPANTFTRHGYRFIGWNTKADGSGTSYADGEIISITANTTLYAQWKKRIYESSYVAKSFSISKDKTICFSSGNLQYHAANKEWRFAPSQLDYVGYENANISPTYNGWIDLFGWGTGNNPTNTSTDYEDYLTFVDWGVNKIGDDAPNTWRTLTYEEWRYICYNRPNAEQLMGIAEIDGVNGMILLPDNWECPSDIIFKPGVNNYFGVNYYGYHQTISASDWSKLESSGAVFFPVSGYRSGSLIYFVQDYGGYWSATEDDYYAYFLYFFSDDAGVGHNVRWDGRSLRLVKDETNQEETPSSYTLSFDGNSGSGSMSAVELEGKASATIPTNTFTRHGYKFIGWNTKADGTGTSYTEGQTISITANTTLYAQWEERIYESSYIAKSFSISEDKTITFSPGNLQYHIANEEWRFAPSQLDYVGYDNRNINVPSYNGWIDLFGWDTGNNPTNHLYSYDHYTFIDWGTNKIGNDAPNTWRTLTKEEWVYICFDRPNADALMGVAQVDGVNGLIILPDNWVCSSDLIFKSGFADEDCIECYGNYQTFSASDWTKLEKTGAVFLPAAGWRSGNVTLYSQNSGAYWASTDNESNEAGDFWFYSNEKGSIYSTNPTVGASVRLVKDETVQEEKPTAYTLFFDANGGSGSMSAVELEGKASATIPTNTFTRPGYEFIGWNTKADGSGTSYADGETISITANTTLYAQWEEFNITGTANGHDYVDLGLPSGTLWATCNVGADSPEEYGDYFAWGETKPKEEYSWATYKWCEGSPYTQTKYCTNSDYGTVDNKTILELSDDAANTNWGGDWRMPTKEEQDELHEECTWTWITQNGVNGYKVTSKTNGNSIFLPTAGRYDGSDLDDAGSDGYYWSSSLNTNFSCNAYILRIYSYNVAWYGYNRIDGQSVRPVMRIEYNLMFDANGGSGSMSAVELDRNESKNIPANTFTRHGYRFIGWNTKADGTGTSYTEGETISITANTTLYAQWEEKTFESSYVAKSFSISEDKTITFSPGNLQYHAVNDEWRFAPSQLDYIGEENKNISPTYNGWIDLFGWGTGNNPTNNSTDTDDYQTFVDWGVNKIGNYAPNTWRTLTKGEWEYIIEERDNASNLIGVARVNGVNGLILLPDNWTCPSGFTFKSGFDDEWCTECYGNYQTFSASDWSKLESSGAVFFPASGNRGGSDIYDVQYYGYSWSVTEYDNHSDADYLYFSSDKAGMSGGYRLSGLSVRLVQEYTEPEPTITLIGSQIGNNNQVEIIANCSVTPKNIIWEVKKENGEFYQVENETGTSLTLTPYEDTYTYVRAYMVNKNDEMIEALPIIISTTCKSVVFKDDFGQLSSETARSASQYVGYNYTYVGDCRPLKEEGTYAVLVNPKYAGYDAIMSSDNSCYVTSSNRLWYRDTYDHTQGGYKNGTWGGMLMVNADAELVYSRDVEVTPYTTMTYSAWAAYAAKPNVYEYDPEEPSNISFVVKDEYGNLLTRMDLELAYDDTIWKQGKVIFNTENNSRVTIELYNYNRGSVQGNDFLIDDISFTVCTEQDIDFIYPAVVKYDSNDGSGITKSDYISPELDYYIPSNIFTRKNHYLASWNTKADGTGTSFSIGTKLDISSNITLYAQWVESRVSGIVNGHSYIDLGLPSGTLWATYNIGANSPYENGDNFAWGETIEKSTYSWSNYKWMQEGMGSWSYINKYTYPDNQTGASWYSNGTFIGDNKKVLELADDVANVNWGSNWHIPSNAEFEELIKECTWTYSAQNNVEGYIVTSKTNGNSIFLPIKEGSYTYYWSNSISTSYSDYAFYLSISPNSKGIDDDARYKGYYIRPVIQSSPSIKPTINNLVISTFKNVYVGESSSATATYTLENATLASATLTGDEAFSIVEQRNGSVQIAFNPTEVGTFNGTLTITTEGNISKSVNFTATALAKPTIISLTAPKFGKVYAGEQAYENATYVVKNANSIVATINGDKAFKIKGQSNGEIIVMFEPTTAGTFNATLTLTLDGIVSSSIEFTATAVLKPVISNLSAPKSVQIYVGESSTLTATYTLENATSATATLTGDKAFSIAKQSNGSVEIIFKPTEAGKFTTTLTITTDDNISNSVSFSSTAVLKPVIADLTTPKFGQVYAGEFANATVTYTLENASSATATLEGDDEFFIKKQSTGEVQIIFMPENAGTFNGTLTITTEGNISKSIEFSATAILKPVISNLTIPTFKQIYVGESSTSTVTYRLENASSATASITGDNVFSIVKQSNSSVQIAFNPTKAGTYTGYLTITTEANIYKTIEFTASAILKPVIANLTTPKFAQTYVGETRTASATYTLENAASATATLTGDKAFSIVKQSNGSVEIAFNPTEAGTFNGTLTITTEGNISKSVSFSATAVLKPVITIISAPKFEQIYVGEFANVTVLYRLENAENVTVALKGDDEFFIKKQSTGEVQISFAPESAGTFNTQLTFITDGNIYKDVNFTATAILKPVISNLTTPKFTQTYIGETRTASATYTLENATSATATLTGDKAFSIVKQSNGSVEIAFNPTAAGTFNGTLTITTEGNISKSVSFSATAVLKPVITIISAPKFEQIYVGEFANVTVLYTLENAENVTVALKGDDEFFIKKQSTGEVQISFAPESAGTFNTQLTIITDGNIYKDVNFTATAILKPVIANLTTPKFAQTYVGESRKAIATYTLENAASATATLTGDKAFSIVKQSNGSVEIAFNPTAAGTYNGTLVITTEGNISKSVSFSATAVLKPVISNLTTPEFAQTYVGETRTATATYILENAASATAKLSGSSAFSIAQQSNGSVQITFKPTAAGTFNGTLTITTEGNITKSVSFSATAVLKPVISNLTTPKFAQTFVGESSTATATYTLENAASATAKLTGSKAFSITKQSSGSVQITFKPTEAGTFNGTLVITTEGNITKSVSFSATAVLKPVITIISEPKFEQIYAGEFSNVTVAYTLENAENVNIALKGDDEFFIKKQSTGEVQIVFAPESAGTFSAVLTITTDYNISKSVSFSATAVLKPVISNLTTPKFEQTYVGESSKAFATYTLENAASATATLTGDKAFVITQQRNGSSVDIAFNPTEAGTFNGTLVITTEGNISKSVSFSATAVLKPVITIISAPKFKQTYVGESSTATVTYLLENSNSATATVIGDKGYFSIVSQSNGLVEIAFNPAATGTFNGTLTITTEGNVTKSVSFSATAVLKPVISNLTITNFKEIYEGDTSIGIATYKLENASSAKAYITGDKDYFSIVKQSNGLVEVAFSPTQAGTFYGELTIITEGEISNSIRFAATAIPRPAIVDIVVPEIKPIRMGEFASITVTYALKNTNSAFATLNGADEFFIRRQSNGEVMIVFTPYYPGTFSTVLTIETEEKISVDIELTATAIADVTTSIDETSNLNIYAKDGTIYCDEEFKIYTVAGLDVTFLNGSLQGVYVVTTEKGNKQVSVW